MNQLKTIKYFVFFSLVFSPFLSSAQTIETTLTTISDILQDVLLFLMAVALVIFIVGILKYVTAGDDEEKRKNGRNTMIYGIIGLFVIISIWGLVEILTTTFGITETGTGIQIPNLPEPGD